MPVTNQTQVFFLRRLTRAVLWLMLSGTLLACGSRAPAGPQIRVQDPWCRPAVALEGAGAGQEGGTGAVFMTLLNEGREAERLVGAQTDAAAVVEIHESQMEGDVMRMVFLPDGLQIPAGGEVSLKPGSFHLMLIGLQRDLNPGDTLTLVLEFEKSGSLTVQAPVRQP